MKKGACIGLSCAVVVVIIVIVLAVTLTGTHKGKAFVGIDCPLPDGSSDQSEEKCNKYSGCDWEDGHCYIRGDGGYGYSMEGSRENTETGFKVKLKKRDDLTMFGGDIETLIFEAVYHDETHLQIKIYDASKPRYEVPLALRKGTMENGTVPLYDVTVTEGNEGFKFSVQRKGGTVSLFKTEGPLLFEDQLIQFTALPSSDFVYGFGEHYRTSFKHDFRHSVTRPMFARDQPVTDNDELNEYGVHPYYMNIEDDEGNAHSVLFYNSNAMEYTTFSLGDSRPAITYRTTGGVIDLHFFLGPTPEDVNKQYGQVIGHPVAPPYWALGFHLSRYGYESLRKVKETRNRMKKAGIPQDVQTFDIDYMFHFRDFTFDPEKWKALPEYIDQLHQEGVRVVLILDPGIPIIPENYKPFSRGLQKEVFIRWMDSSLVPKDQPLGMKDFMVGYLWPDAKVVYPDFFNPNATKWWTEECRELHKSLKFDGLWIDMNEPSNFGTNLDRPFNYPETLPDWSLKCPSNQFDTPPFPTKAAYDDVNLCNRLSDKTLCMSALHSDGKNKFLHYDVHSLYGIMQTKATYQALDEIFPNKRHLVLSRSTFPGSGHLAAHWLGDNNANWQDLNKSIVGLLEFNMFLIPNVGADICGFFGTPSEELCVRWTQLGAFYPFSRNHNTKGTPDQDPANPEWPTVKAVARKVLLLRYKYLPFLYTLFHKVSMHGGSIVRPLWNAFPNPSSLRTVDDQFLWGDKLMVAPVVAEGAREREVVFPEGKWYDLVKGTLEAEGFVRLNVSAPLTEIPVFIRGGVILPFQEPGVTTTLSRQNPFGLTIALDKDGNAQGDLFYDDGESVHTMANSYMSSFAYEQLRNTLSMSVMHGEELVAELKFSSFFFYGFPWKPVNISVVGDATRDSIYGWQINDYNYHSATKVLAVGVELPLGQNFQMKFTPPNDG